MEEKELANIRWRTDSKLRRASAHFLEMIESGDGGDDFERSHLESCLFHLIGARDAFLSELVKYYSLDDIESLTVGRVRDSLKSRKKSTQETAELLRRSRSLQTRRAVLP